MPARIPVMRDAPDGRLASISARFAPVSRIRTSGSTISLSIRTRASEARRLLNVQVTQAHPPAGNPILLQFAAPVKSGFWKIQLVRVGITPPKEGETPWPATGAGSEEHGGQGEIVQTR